jgi:EAL domain-containing protein (putative c-di-GMP-specific phosphodiesterase class I)
VQPTDANRTPLDFFADILAEEVGRKGVARMLKTLRRHLGMDVAFVSHFRTDDRIMEHVDSDTPVLQEGMSIPLEEGYCRKVVRGELPECIPDTSEVPAALDIPATSAIPIGSHLSVPVLLESGDVYGTLCCFSFKPNHTLGARDMQLLRAFAEVLAQRIDEIQASDRRRDAQAEAIYAAMGTGGPRIVYQPITRIMDKKVFGLEALARFDMQPYRSPDQWFLAAHRANVGVELELHTIRKALRALPLVPQGVKLGVNGSPHLILSGRLREVLAAVDTSRVVLELTEHQAVGDYDALVHALRPLRTMGVNLAVDDAGAGYSSMRHILKLEPSSIKLDMSLTRDIDTDRKRKALARGLISFAHEIGSIVIAEGVETADEYQTLQQLGVDGVQGYLIAKPSVLDEALSIAAAWAQQPMLSAAEAENPGDTAADAAEEKTAQQRRG